MWYDRHMMELLRRKRFALLIAAGGLFSTAITLGIFAIALSFTGNPQILYIIAYILIALSAICLLLTITAFVSEAVIKRSTKPIGYLFLGLLIVIVIIGGPWAWATYRYNAQNKTQHITTDEARGLIQECNVTSIATSREADGLHLSLFLKKPANQGLDVKDLYRETPIAGKNMIIQEANDAEPTCGDVKIIDPTAYTR